MTRKNILLSSAVLASALFALYSCGSRSEKEEAQTAYLCGEVPTVYLYDIDEEAGTVTLSDSLPRGSKFQSHESKRVKINKEQYREVITGSGKTLKTAFVPEENFTLDSTGFVREKFVYVRSASTLIEDTLTSSIASLANKGDSLEVCGYDYLYPDGRVHRYKVHYGKQPDSRLKSQKSQQDRPVAWIYSKYTTFDHESSLLRYDKYDKAHAAVRNPFGGGKAIDCDYYPHEKPQFPDNKMPESCYALYLNFSPAVLGNIEEYIALAKETLINTFVIDIKDNECPGYKADAMMLYSPTNYAKASKRGAELYERVVRRLHEEGFYVVGRITCFKDSYFVKDHPESAITELATGEPFKHNKSYWPSAFDRKVWQFNVELAKESIRRFGFDEINFDYVRFPDRMTRIEDKIDYHNRYGESKAQAIQRFVTYACDEIHPLGAYVSIDVFGECANEGYTTAYGQYWPALSNVADVMCGMPYPDHFTDGYYGISKPWNHPYELLHQWGKRIAAKQKVTPSPAKVRTWIQVWKVMKHVDKNGIDYDAKAIENEIRGLYSAGLMDGYCTWLSSSNIKRYRSQKEAYSIDYYTEYKSGKAPMSATPPQIDPVKDTTDMSASRQTADSLQSK